MKAIREWRENFFPLPEMRLNVYTSYEHDLLNAGASGNGKYSTEVYG